jgi:hypothetical protein
LRAMQHSLSCAQTPPAHCKEINTKHSKQIFPEKELCGHNANFHSHVSVSDL